MLPKSRLALIGLGVSLVVAAAWLARSLNAPVALPPPASAQAATTPAAAPATAPGAPEAGAPPARESFAPASAPAAAAATPAARPLTFGASGAVRLEDVPAGRFHRDLQRLAPEARQRALQQLGDLHIPLNDVASLRVDRRGRLWYGCEPPDLLEREVVAAELAAEPAISTVRTRQAAAVPVSSPPIRHSKPGAASVIYLDFNGHTITGTAWNEGQGEPTDADYEAPVLTYVARPYSTDTDYTTFTDTEQADIVEIWARVAEDYAPFNVDVTTEDPGTFTNKMVRVMITPKKDANEVYLPLAASVAGVSYMDVFGFSDFADYSPAFIYYAPGYSPADLAGNVSHETGHYLSLAHDGTTTEEYYSGHGSGLTSWGPIMGLTYGRAMGQWSKGEYYQANNTEDDLAIMGTKFGYRYAAEPDDRADSNVSATPLTVSGNTLSGTGLIGVTGDADRFSFTTGGGDVSFTVTSYLPGTQTQGSNLDVALELYNGGNTLVASSDVAGTTLSILNSTLGAGTYYLRVRGVGTGDPLSISPSGYTNYDSLGEYTITGTAAGGGGGAPPSITQHPSSTIAGIGQMAGFTAQASNATGYRWQRLPAAGGGWGDLSDGGTYTGTGTTALSIDSVKLAMDNDQFRLVATNGSGSVVSNPATLTVNNPVGPGFAAQPVSLTTAEDEWVTFSVSATGTPPIVFQWQYLPPGTSVWSNVLTTGGFSGVTSDSLSFFAPLALNGAQFRCWAGNQVGNVMSASATLTVVPKTKPEISGLPAAITIAYQQTLQLTPTVTGSPTLQFQWTRNGADIPGEFHQDFGPWPADSSMTGDYVLRVTNTWGTVYSGHVQVTVTGDPNEVPPRPAFFNASGYRANNPDVYFGYIPNWEDYLWAHYWRYGIAEGRTDGDFSVQAYLAQYPNLAAQFGTDLQAAALYWYTTGRQNGDRVPAGFSVAGYFLRNSDIAAIFANDKYGAWLHYYNYGVFEGRSYDANFIVDEYLELNPDLKTAFGTNKQAALMHWLRYGHPIEDRMGRVPIGFNVDSYLARYPDLEAVFGDITPKAVRNVTVWHHYVAYGTLEGRTDGDFEAYNYLATNPDLAAVFGSDIRAAALHWFFYGRREGRRIPGGFDVADYRVRYPDIVVGLGDDLYGSWLHYRDTGVTEGRVFGELFRPADYLALNPDVAAVIGNSYREALLHWLFYGQFEGRPAKF